MSDDHERRREPPPSVPPPPTGRRGDREPGYRGRASAFVPEVRVDVRRRSRGDERAGPATTPDLVAGCRRGDRASWVRLVARFETLVYTVARRNGLGPEDAADVTQITFKTLLEEIDRVREIDSLSSWLATVARRQSWRVLRKSDREPVLEVEDAPGDDPFVDWERFAVLNEAVEAIGEPCRSLLTMLFFDPSQPSHAEIADRLGRAIGGIGPLRGRCLDKLRLLLDDGGPW